MKIKVILIALLILTNLMWGIFTYHNLQTQSVSTTIYQLSGSSESWTVENYMIIITPSTISRGHAKLIYKGDKDNLHKDEDFSFQAYEPQPNGEQRSVYALTSNVTDGELFSTGVKKDMGSIAGPNDKFAKQKDKSHYSQTQVVIKWKDASGQGHEEVIDLSIEKTMILPWYK